MVFNRALAQHQALRDEAIGESRGDQRRHFPLAPGKPAMSCLLGRAALLAGNRSGETVQECAA